MLKIRKYALASLLLAAFSASAATVDYSPNAFGEKNQWYGFNREETYDVAVHLASPEFVGKKVKGLKVNIPGGVNNVKEVSGWLSASLDADFTPTIATGTGEYRNQVLDITFSEPYEVPASGLYVGYSFKVTRTGSNGSDKPIAYVTGNTPEALWVKSSSSQKKWADYSKRYGYVSTMTVILEGDFAKDAATPSITDEIVLGNDKGGSVEVYLTNWGTEPIGSIDYSYTTPTLSGKGSYTFTTPIAGAIGRQQRVAIDIPGMDGSGVNDLTVTVDKVNGAENAAIVKEVVTPFTLQPFVPNYRPLVEEFTGLNCGYCPRGYVMLEDMKHQYGDEFVALSYHSTGWEGDAMTCIDPEKFPLIPGGYPSASLNRNATTDPSDIPAMWEGCYKNQTPGEIQVDYQWTDDTHTMLKATASARFLKGYTESDYRIAFAVLADGLCNEKWVQSNYYNTYSPSDLYPGENWALFIGTDKLIPGLVFNDIVVKYDEIRGIEGSLPATINAGEWYEYTYEFSPEDVTTLQGTHLVSNFDKTRVVAIIIDSRTNGILNCVSSIYPDGNTAVKGVDTEAEVVSTVYYNLQGIPVTHRTKGLVIKEERLANGERRISKQLN